MIEEVSEMTKEEVLEELNKRIGSCEKRLDSAINFGWIGKEAVSAFELRFYSAIRDFIENTGEKTSKMTKEKTKGVFVHWCNIMESGGGKYGWGKRDEEFKGEVLYLIENAGKK